MTSAPPANGLLILRASRLEALVRPLQQLLAATAPDDPLAPQRVIAAHPGMKQWLTGELARKVGPARIVANLEVMLPSTWLDSLATARLGQRAVALPRYQRRHLRWTLHALLSDPAAVPGLDDPRIATYLGRSGPPEPSPAELARRRFQLADRLAGLYSQYLVYRPDWLQAWQGGLFDFATRRQADAGLRTLESRLLAPLWKQVEHQLGEHRATAMDELQRRLHDAGPGREPLHVFGLSHLADAEMRVLRAYATQAPVLMYVPDPCREYWGGLVRPLPAETAAMSRADLDPWQRYATEETARIDAAGDGDWWQEQDHPLLARWGRLGQHFFAQLVDGEVREDIRHAADEAATAPVNRLSRLQESIRRLDPELMREPPGPASACTDASLRIHACHTRLRELEVLRDALLDAIERDKVRAGEIVVMAPDIAAYAPLIPSVFGEPGSARERLLPYHLADVPVSRSHVLFSTFARLLDVAASRLTTPEVVDLLAVPEVQRRFGLDGDAVDALVDWLGDSRVAWALDARHRAAFGVPPVAEHTFAWAMDRMLAGYVMADSAEAGHDEAFAIADGTVLLPVAGVHGPAAEAIGALDRLLVELQRWRDFADGRARKASAWATELQERIDSLFRIDRMDEGARSALAALKKIIAGLQVETARAGEDPPLHFAVVRDLLLDALAAVPERQRFLMGGITFCGMVPQRAIPFAVVAVLGLDDGAFPRTISDGGIDLMTRLRRLGDRDVRLDDRYLFLETVMSARKRLHLSYLGLGVRDGKPRNPAAPLAELMAELDRASGLAVGSGEGPDEQRPWWLWHPLQPFDARYFDGKDTRQFSYSGEFAAMQGNGRAPVPAFLDGEPSPPLPMPTPVALSSLTRHFRKPADELLKSRLGLSLAALDSEQLPADEPLDAKLPAMETIARRVFLADALPRGFEPGSDAPRWDRKLVPAWVRHSGLLPAGALGEKAWDREANAVVALMKCAHAVPGLAGLADVRPAEVPIDLVLAPGAGSDGAGVRVRGTVQGAVAIDGGWTLVRAFPNADDKESGALKDAAKLDLGEQLELFIHWAVLRLQSARAAQAAGAPLPPVRLAVLAKGGSALAAQLCAWDAHLCTRPADRAAMLDELAGRLRALVDLWWRASSSPPVYFPRTSSKVLTACPAADPTAPPADPEAAAAAARIELLAAEAAAVEKFESAFNRPGERDYAPAYTRLLARGLRFSDDEGRPVEATLHALLAHARLLSGLMTLTIPEAADA